MSKKADAQTITGESAIHLITAVVDAMGHLWHPTVGKDSGIDGEIELRDPGTREVRNVRIGVQSRGTEQRLTRETEHGFSYRPSAKDLAYWLSSNQPVLLVISRPSSGVLYWRSVQEWAQNPIEKAKGYLRFDKERDRFDASAGPALFDLRATAEDRVEPPQPPHIGEETLINHMPVRFKAETLFSVAVRSGSPLEVLGPAWAKGLRHPGALRSCRYYSLRDFDGPFASAVGADDRAEHPLEPVLSGEEPDLSDVLKEVTIRILVDRVPELRWHAQKGLAYFRRAAEHEPVTRAWHPGQPRTVVDVKFSSEADRHFMRYRHDAARLALRFLAGRWTLQINPTYLFTSDGHKLSGYHDKWLAGMKRLDRHVAVSSALRMWEHLLVEETTLERPNGDDLFALDPLLQIALPRSILDKTWRELTPDEAGAMSHDDASELTLFGEAA